jgi:hypothetical protein
LEDWAELGGDGRAPEGLQRADEGSPAGASGRGSTVERNPFRAKPPPFTGKLAGSPCPEDGPQRVERLTREALGGDQATVLAEDELLRRQLGESRRA